MERMKKRMAWLIFLKLSLKDFGFAYGDDGKWFRRRYFYYVEGM